MTDIVAKNGAIFLGHQGENLVTRVVLPNIREGAGTIALLHQRAGDATPYLVSVTEDADHVYWAVTSVDTAAANFGRAELQWLGAAGEVLKSKIYRTYTEQSLTAPGPAPDPWEDLAGKVAASADAAKKSEDAAARYADTAYQAGTAATESAERAAGSATAAAESEENATAAANQATTAATGAETSASAAAASSTSASTAAEDASAALKALEDGIAAGDFKGEKGDKGDKGDPGTDGKDAPQIDDDAISADNPWSSKHIVDMLCPPIDETGNPVQCYPVPGYPLGVVVSWEPTQEGSGDPSPENIRPIKGRDCVMVERCGENLIRFPYYYSKREVNGLVFEPQQDGSIVVNGTATEDTYYMINASVEQRLPMDTIMTLSGCPAGGNIKRYYIGLYLGGRWFADLGASNTGVRFNKRTIRSRVELTIAKGTVCKNLTFYPKLEIGNTATPYCKYQGGTLNLILHSTVYGGEAGADGAGRETRKLLTLDGNELKFSKRGIYYNLPHHSAPGILANGIICISHFNRKLFGVNTNYEFCFLVESDIVGLFASVDDLNAYLAAQYAAGTPVQICYKLAEPVSFTATGAQPLPALAGANTVLTDADSATVTGRADPIKRIEDLEAAVASQT